jgi:hypothetical protein
MRLVMIAALLMVVGAAMVAYDIVEAGRPPHVAGADDFDPGFFP